jgi:hypothetical protein
MCFADYAPGSPPHREGVTETLKTQQYFINYTPGTVKIQRFRAVLSPPFLPHRSGNISSVLIRPDTLLKLLNRLVNQLNRVGAMAIKIA